MKKRVHIHMGKFIALAAVAALAGCVASAPKQALPQQQAPKVAKSSAPAVPVPPGLQDLSKALSEEQMYAALLAWWVTKAKDEKDLVERGVRAYPMVRFEYFARLKSNHTTQQAAAIVLPMIRERVQNAPSIAGRYYMEVPPRELGTAGNPSFNKDKDGIAIWGFVGNSVRRPARFDSPPSESMSAATQSGRPMTATQRQVKVWGEVLADAELKKGMDEVLRVAYLAEVKSHYLPLTPQQQYDLNRKGQIRASIAGGIVEVEGPKLCYFEHEDNSIKCQFGNVGQSLAPIVVKQ